MSRNKVLPKEVSPGLFTARNFCLIDAEKHPLWKEPSAPTPEVGGSAEAEKKDGVDGAAGGEAGDLGSLREQEVRHDQ